jgi:EpsI family protein
MAREHVSPRRSIELSRRHVLLGGILALASGAALARQPQPARAAIPTDEFSQWIPGRVGDWSVLGTSGVVLPPPDELRDRLYDNVLTRTYVAQDQPVVMLLLAYNNLQDGVLQVHRPEVCYPVGGFELSETREVGIAAGGRTIPANAFTATGPDRTEQVMYFTRLAQAFPRSWLEQ